MNKSELIAVIAKKADLSTAKAEDVLRATLEGIATALKEGDSVSLVGFGNFGTKKRGSRSVRNPRTGKTMTLAPTIVPYFKAGKNLKEAVDTDKK